MQRKLNRLTPAMPAAAMTTFAISAPKATHTRKASCEEVECEQYAKGWKVQLDLNTDLGQRQAYYIKHNSGRSYKVTDQREGLVTLEFRPGQPCFGEHRLPIGRPEKFLVKGGDFRGNPLGTTTRVHTKQEFWVEEFAENQDRLKTRIERG